MNIHFFVRTLNEKSGGGSHYNSIAYIRALRKAGHTVQVHVLYDAQDNAFPSDIQPVVHGGLGLSFLGERAYLARLLKEYEPEADIFFLYAVEFAWGGGLYRKRGGTKPVVVYMDAYLASMGMAHPRRAGFAWYRYKRFLWDKTIGLSDAKHVDRFLPCSPYIGEAYKRYGFPEDKFTVLPNIVPPPDAPAPVARGKGDGLRVLYAGRFTYDKGVDLLIGALSEKKFTGALKLVGDGEMRGAIETAAREAGLRVEMPGWIPQRELSAYYDAADIFVHPARWPDPAPRGIVDALHHGLPVVIPDTGGGSWIAGSAGRVFKTGDKESLAGALNPLIDDAAVRARLALAARGEAHKFEQAVVYPQLEGILKSAIAHHA